VVIRHSSAREVTGLLRDLQAADDRVRDAAAARLAIIGTRAVDGLVGVLTSAAPVAARAAALAALEPTADLRAIDPAFACLEGEDASLVGPAAGVLRRTLDSPRGTEVLDRLAAILLDRSRPDQARLAAFDALHALPDRVLDPLRRALASDPSPALRAAAGPRGPAPEIDPKAALEAAADGRLPEDPESIRRWIGADSGAVTLPVLHRLVEAIRSREARATGATEGAAWMTARAAVHQTLAARGSRVALYDLREMLDRAPAAPVEVLASLEAIGDKSCLEPIAAVCARLDESAQSSRPTRSDSGSDAWWRHHLIHVFRVIAVRERLTERHATARRIRTRWPAAARDLLGPPRA